MENLIAQIQVFNDGGFQGAGDIGNVSDAAGASTIFNNVISTAIGLMTVIAGLWFIFQFILGAWGVINSGGDKARLEEARQKITQAAIGLVIVIAAIFLVDIIGGILGLDILSGLDSILVIKQ